MAKAARLPVGINSSCEIFAEQLLSETSPWTLVELGEFMGQLSSALLHYDKAAFYRLKARVKFIGRPYWRATANRPTIAPSVRREVFSRDDFKCLHCGAVDLLEVDHVVPFSRGGEHGINNFQTLCKPCNRKKGARV